MLIHPVWVKDLQLTGVVVCVEYDDYLRLSLHRNFRWFKKLYVVTSNLDADTASYVLSLQETAAANGCELILVKTDVFYQNNQRFNKGAAIEHVYELSGRKGWFLNHDADVILPSPDRQLLLDPNMLYGVPRRMLRDAESYTDELDWTTLERHPNFNLKPGYFQLFNGSTPCLRSKPWYPTNCPTAATSDKIFCHKFPGHLQRWLDFEVLHLGPEMSNWSGRCTPRLDGRHIPQAAEREAAHLAKRSKAQRTWLKRIRRRPNT
jgi:hypothetical protein